MISSTFTPCANIITGSTNNGLVPSTTCCDSLRSLMSTNMDCACLMMSSNAQIFQLPINQVLAISLSQACNINGASVQCKGPTGIGSNSPTLPSSAPTPLSPQDSKTLDVNNAHIYENLQLAEALVPSSAPMEAAEAPTEASRIIPVLTSLPSASPPSYYSFSPSALFKIIAIVMVSGIIH
ncbi:Lipid transfer protein [Medicago truncatula]|uniref:Lipid transfer protein n=2 Tax=Medicago truncatula TaxID=3880 RepID=A0A072U353_MEDTR|nr:Lipid transfer protein [Medicago truncatula]